MKYIVLLVILALCLRVSGQPPVVNGLTLYLDATSGISGNPAVWQDLSGNGNHVTANLSLGNNPTMATIRGRSTVRFDGNSIMVSNNPNIVTGTTGTIFTVASNVTQGTKVSVCSNNDLGQELLLLGNVAYHNTSPNNFVGIGHQCISAIPFDSVEIESATYRPLRFLSDVTHYINGIPANGNASIHNYGSPVDYNNVGRYAYIGSRIKNNNLYGQGVLNLYEVLVYNRELTQAEVDSVHQYLKCKYAVSYTTCNVAPVCATSVPRTITWQDSCSSSNIGFSLSNTSLIDSIEWNFGDMLSGSNTASIINPFHDYALPGRYAITATVWSMGVIDTIRDTITIYNDAFILNLGNDTTYCGNFVRTLNASQNGAANYLWQDGSISSTYQVNSAGQYWVMVSGPCDTIRDTINIMAFDSIESVNINVGICQGGNVLLNAYTPSATNYLWQDNSTSTSLQVSLTGTYTVALSNFCFSAMDTFEVVNYPSISWTPFVDTALCEGDQLQLNIENAEPFVVQWDNGSMDTTRTIDTGGIYWVSVSSQCETVRDTIVVDYLQNLIVSLGNDTVLCSVSDTLVVLDAGVQPNYLWQDGSTGSNYVVTSPGVYTVQISNRCNVFTDSIAISIASPLSWQYINDTAACAGSTITLDISMLNIQGYAWRWSDGVLDSLRMFEASGTYSLEISNGCEQIIDTVEVVYYLLPEVDLGNDTTICGTEANAAFRLDAGENYIYEWQDNSTNRYYDVTETGIYTVTVTSAEGCTNADTVEIGKEGIYIPNAFSPNGDGINDFYRVYGMCFDTFKIQIFNRWGSLVFESNNEHDAWDGRFRNSDLVPGLFVYQIYYIDIFGEENYKTGSIILLR